MAKGETSRDAYSDQMGGVEVIRVGMRLQKIAQRREVFAKMGRTGRSIRPQIQKKISIDEQAGAPAQILSPKGTGLAANRAAAKGEGKGSCGGSAKKCEVNKRSFPAPIGAFLILCGGRKAVPSKGKLRFLEAHP